MKKFAMCIVIVAQLVVLAASAAAQEYRGRVQGSVVDESKGALPGASVVLRNDATGVSVTRQTSGEGRYVFDFVDPGTYTITAELSGFKRIEQKNVTVSQRGDVTADLSMSIGGIEETVTVEAPPVAVQFNTASHDITLEKQLLDQVPIAGRNPYNLRRNSCSTSGGQFSCAATRDTGPPW